MASYSPIHTHEWVSAALQGAASLTGNNLESSVLPKDTTMYSDGAGLEPPTFWSLDNPLYLLSSGHLPEPLRVIGQSHFYYTVQWT